MANDFLLSELELEIVEIETTTTNQEQEDQQDYISNIVMEYEILNKRCDEILSKISARKNKSNNPS